MDWVFVSNRLIEARKMKDMKQLEVAKLAGITTSQLCQWETGKVCPSAENLAKISTVLGANPRYFFAHSGNDGNDINGSIGNEI